MSRTNEKTLPAAREQQRPVPAARSVRQVQRHVTQAIRNTGLERLRIKALVAGIGYEDGALFISLFQSQDEEKQWVLRARVEEPARKALEDAIGGPLNQRYLAAHIVADVLLGLTDEFKLAAIITSIVEMRPYRDF